MFTRAIRRVLTGDLTLQTEFDLFQLMQILVEPVFRFLNEIINGQQKKNIEISPLT